MEILKYHALALLIGYVLDLIIGDPHSLPHPIRVIGRLISYIEKKTYRDTKRAGLVLVCCVMCAVCGVVALITFATYKFNPYVGMAIESVLSFYCLATKSLKVESKKVVTALNKDGLESARKNLSMIVGRDTDNLSVNEVIRATVETVAENTSDGVIAPLLWLTLLGPVGGYLYKAVNTMDSMVGYKNDRYENYGYCAAKLDDLFNYIPSRVTALLIVLSAFTLGLFSKEYSGKGAFKIWARDKRNHKSPNSAQSESAYAGALSIRLAGGAYYFGKWVEKPFIGDDIRDIEVEDVARSHRILFLTSIMCEAVCTAVIYIIIKLNMIFL